MKYTLAILTFCAVSIILFSGCKKENTSGTLTYQLTTAKSPKTISRAGNADGISLKIMAGTFSWTSGTGQVSDLKFEIKGDNKVEYKSKASQAVNLFDPISTLGVVHVPAGTYEKVEFKLDFEPVNNSPAFELTGSFTNSAGITTPVIFRVHTPFRFSYEKKTPTTIDGAANQSALNTLDLNLLFSGLSEAALNSAVRDNTGTIIISSNSNTSLYNQMWSSSDAMLKVEIK